MEIFVQHRTTRNNKQSGRINARKKHSCPFASNNPRSQPPVKPKPIPVVTEIRTYCPKNSNNNSISKDDDNGGD
ncbi:hypothetical protein BLA29_012549, partial [Euroglyphus maynei]